MAIPDSRTVSADSATVSDCSDHGAGVVGTSVTGFRHVRNQHLRNGHLPVMVCLGLTGRNCRGGGRR